jgi:hypothetical protein
MPHFSDLCVETWGIGEGGGVAMAKAKAKPAKKPTKTASKGKK